MRRRSRRQGAPSAVGKTFVDLFFFFLLFLSLSDISPSLLSSLLPSLLPPLPTNRNSRLHHLLAPRRPAPLGALRRPPGLVQELRGQVRQRRLRDDRRGQGRAAEERAEPGLLLTAQAVRVQRVHVRPRDGVARVGRARRRRRHAGRDRRRRQARAGVEVLAAGERRAHHRHVHWLDGLPSQGVKKER